MDQIGEARDESLRYAFVSPQCVYCRHVNDKVRLHCAAFGDQKIPLDIWNGDVSHDHPIEGDHGLQFEWFDNPE